MKRVLAAVLAAGMLAEAAALAEDGGGNAISAERIIPKTGYPDFAVELRATC
ncbi:hypothetical protein [Methylobacterium oxalidis]|uniref:hypothetical protein n=1 Tax=Methylobacterium oxalidis TaxID=944322 RepID=UPI003315A30E